MPLSYRDTSLPVREPLVLLDAKAQCVVSPDFLDDDTYLTRLIVAARQHVERKIHRAIFPRTMQLFLDFFPYPNYDGTINPNDRHCLYGYFWHALAIRLPRPRALSVQSITYIDLSGVLQTFSPTLYFLDATSEPARIVPNPGVYWPYTQSWLPGSVTVSYTAGSYVLQVSGESVVVPSAAPYALPLAQLGDYVGMASLVDSLGNPVTASGGASPAVAASYAGQTLTASYYTANCPETVKQAMLLLISYWYNHRDSAEASAPAEIAQGVDALLAPETFDTFGY